MPDNVLLPVGNARVLVGRRGALLLVPVPPAVRVHRVQAGLLARESSHIINMYYILCVQEVVTPIYIMSYYINWVTTSWTCRSRELPILDKIV